MLEQFLHIVGTFLHDIWNIVTESFYNTAEIYMSVDCWDNFLHNVWTIYSHFAQFWEDCDRIFSNTAEIN